MTYQYLVVNDRPDGAWSLDSYPFVDISGNGRYASGRRIYNYSRNPTLADTTNVDSLGSASVNVTVVEEGLFAPSSLRVSATNAGSAGRSIHAAINSSSSARTFTVGFWVQTNSGKSISTFAHWVGTTTGSSPSNPLNSVTSNSGWQFVRGTFTLPANATSFKAGPLMTSAASGDSFLISGSVVVEGTELDPSTLNLGDMFNTRTVSAPHGTAYILSQPSTSATPLVSTTGPAVQITPARPLEFDSDVMARKFYTLEAWFKPLATPAPITILGRTANSEGLVWDGEAFRFRTNFATAPYAEAIYYPTDQERAHHVVGVSTALTNQLWVDGVLEAEVILSEAQRADAPASTSNALISGYSTNADSTAIVDFPAVYARSLDGAEIVEHFNAGRATDDFINTILYHAGDYWTLDDNTTILNRVDRFDSIEDWARGEHGGLSSTSGVLVPDYEFNGTTVEGEWKYGFGIKDLPPITKSKIEWDSDGPVVVEFSTDDITWVPCVSGRTLPGLTDATDSIAIRIRFPSGVSADTALVVRSLTLTLYQDITMTSSRGNRSIQWFGEVAPGTSRFRPIEQADLGRLEAFPGYGVITASSLPDDQPNIGTLELWVKPSALGANQQTLVDFTWGGTAGARVWWTGSSWEFENCTVYVNGQPMRTGFNNIGLTAWSHVMVIPSTPSPNAVRILSDSLGAFPLPARLGLVVVYNNALDPTAIGDIYNSYLSVSTLYIGESSTISVREPAQPARAYSLEWSVQTA